MLPSAFAALPPQGAMVAPSVPDYRLESAAFVHALIALSAKVATIDGAPTKAEYAAFQALFVDGKLADAAQMRSLFVQRAGDTSSPLQYARQVAAMTVGQEALHRDLLARLMQVALADGALNAAELELLRAVSDVLAIDKDTFRTIIGQGMVPVNGSPYEVLGVSPRVTDEELREQYMARVQKLHPDRYQAAGASAETIAMLSEQLAAVNAAYHNVSKARAKKAPRSSTGGSSAWWRRNTKGASS
jgi:DnaJ like chaperone protein